MKANVSLTKRYVPKWNGNDTANAADQLVAVLKMPVVADVFTILERLAALGFKAGEAEKVSLDQAARIAKEAGEFVPKYITLDNAEDFGVDDVITYLPYFALATELLFALVEFAQPTEADVKNSKGLPA